MLIELISHFSLENDPFAPDAPKNPFAMVTYSSPTAIIAVSPTSNPFDLEHDSPFDEENKKEKVSKFGIEAPKASTAAKTLFAVDGEKQMSKMTSAVVAKMESTIQAVVPVPVHSVVKKIGKGKNERQGLRADDEDDEEEEEEEYLVHTFSLKKFKLLLLIISLVFTVLYTSLQALLHPRRLPHQQQ